MLTAVEFDNQVPRDAAAIGKVWTNPVLPAEFESATALGSGVRPQLALLVSRLGTKTPASIARSNTGAGGPARHSASELINRAPRKAR